MVFHGLKDIERVSCVHCQKPFVKKTPWHRTCSEECRKNDYLIREANKIKKEKK